MIRKLVVLLAVFGLAFTAQASDPYGADLLSGSAIADTVHVAPPTGEEEADRTRIISALDKVRPGDTVQFAAGKYLVGQFIDVVVPEITLLGHPDGTTLRGCDPAKFEDKEVAAAECNGFVLTGGHQTVRNFTFEYTYHALALGCEPKGCRPGAPLLEFRSGGYLVEHNIFRESPNGIRIVGQWSEPAVIRNNQFVNTYHAVMVNGMTAHILDNRISVPEAERVPNTRHPGLALMIGGWAAFGVPSCDHNIIAGNRIEGHPDAIMIMAFPESACRRNVIRDNVIKSEPVKVALPSTAVYVRGAADSTVAGAPIILRRSNPEAVGLDSQTDSELKGGMIEDNLIEGNRILGASGVAIELIGASRNRFVENTITGVIRRDPFPGNTLFSEPPQWRDANGSGIWVSSGSDENEIIGNIFQDIAAFAIVLEGDNNHAEMQNADDTVRDLGSSNRVTQRPGGQ